MLDLNQLKQSMPKKAWEEVKTKLYRHTRGVGIDLYLQKQRPSEPKEVLKWRIDTLNKLTKDIFRKGLNNANRALIENPLLLDANEEVKQYVESDNFYSHSGWVNLFAKLVDNLQVNIEDPNGLLIVMPISENKEDLTPQATPQNEKIGFKVDYVDSDNVYFYSHDLAIYMWNGRLFYDDNETMWELIETKGGYAFELWYNHNTGHKLSTYLGGYKSSDENGKAYFDSFFDGAVEFADAFMNNNENFRASMVRNAYPISEFREMPCNVCDGKKYIIDEENQHKECGTCHGTGKLFNYNTNTVFIRPKKTSLVDDNASVQADPLVTFYSPPIEGMQLNMTYCDELYRKAGEAIGATITNSNQSGVAKQEDKESYYSMMAQVQQNVIRLYQFSVSCIQSIWANDTETPIKATATGDIRKSSTSYLVDTIEIYKNANVPAQMIANQMSELLKKNSSFDEATIIRLLPQVDVLYGKPSTDIVMLKSMAGSPVNDYTLYVNLNAYRLFKTIDLENKEDFQIINEFNTLAKREFEVNKPNEPNFDI
jgi:hypothetical protein